jgi:NADPH:quinone reductase
MTLSIVINEFGGPEVLQRVDRDAPTPGPGEVQIAQTAIGLNFIDIYHRTGLYPLPLPLVPGQEGAGIVVALGEGVTGLEDGDRVAYAGSVGAYAHVRNIGADQLVVLPAHITNQVAAATLLKGMTAWFLLHETFAVRPGHIILAQAAAGGVGLILTQWAKALGATVIGCAGSAEKCALALENGCDAAINYTETDFVAEVARLTEGAGVDVVYDGVGKATFEKSLDCLKPRGLMVSFGNATGPVAIPNLGVLAAKGSLYVTRPTMATYLNTKAARQKAADALFAAMASGDIKAHINQTFSLHDVRAAHRALAARQTTGSTLLLP